MTRPKRTLALLATLILLTWALLLAHSALDLALHLRQARALAADPTGISPAEGCRLVQDIRSDVTSLRRWGGLPARLAPLFGWLPVVGGDLRAAPHLLTVADGLSEAGSLACDLLAPALSDVEAGGFSPEEAVSLLAAGQEEMTQAAAAVARAEEAWAQVPVASLYPPLGDRAALVERGLSLLRAGFQAAALAPPLLGTDAPRTYLVLALNEDELRAGGGFISGVGEIHLAAGRVVTMTFRDSYAVDDFTQPYPLPPEPLSRFMDIGLWVFRDSNWSPDFPTAARQAIALYRPGYPVTVDGVVALDQQAVQALIAALGPLTLDDGTQVTGADILDYIRVAWNPAGGETTPEWWRNRKAFMGLIAGAAWERVQSGAVDWVALGRAALRLLDEKHLLVYLVQPEAEAILSSLGWDGALRAGPGDYLLVVDTNMGFNKVNARVQEEIVYRVDLRPTPPQAGLTLLYTHTSTATAPCDQRPHYGDDYADMMERCYWDYIRIYAPAGSALTEATQLPVPGAYLLTGEDYDGRVAVSPAEEGDWTVFGVLGLLRPGENVRRAFVWTLPEDVVQLTADGEEVYTLRVQKQPGTAGHPLTVRIHLPEGSRLIESVPRPTTAEDGWLIYRQPLSRDREYTLRFRRGD